MENVKARSELPKCAGRSFSPTSGPDRYPTPSRDSFPMRPLSYWMQFDNRTLRPSGEASEAGSGLGRSLGSIPLNRPLEKADKDGMGDLGG